MKRINVSTGAKWEPIVGYSRAVRVGPHVSITGTTATLPGGGHVQGGAYVQARQALANVATALRAAGASLGDVVRTRIYLTDIARDWEEVGRAHPEVFGGILPAATMVNVRRLIEEWMRVEIEADAIVGATRVESRRVQFLAAGSGPPPRGTPPRARRSMTRPRR